MGLDSPIPALPPKRRAKLLTKLGEHAQLSHCRTPGEEAPRFIQTPLRARRQSVLAPNRQRDSDVSGPCVQKEEVESAREGRSRLRARFGKACMFAEDDMTGPGGLVGGWVGGWDMLAPSRWCGTRGELRMRRRGMPRPAAGKEKEGGERFSTRCHRGHTAVRRFIAEFRL